MTQRLARPDRRKFLVGAAAAIGFPALPRVPAQAKPPSLPFLAFGDWGRGGTEHQREVGIGMGKVAAALRSRFVITVGDNFYDDGVSSIDDMAWRRSFEEIYAAPSLQTPWNVILGNHDYRGSVQAQFVYGSVSPRWRLPARYYKRTEALGNGATADYFYIDTSPFIEAYRGTAVRIDDQDTAAQIAWLERALSQSQAPWKIVVGHHPVFTVSGGDENFVELIQRVKPLLDRYGVRAYINGHIHNQQHLVVDGVHYITSGAGSRTEPVPPPGAGEFTSDRHGFMALEHSADALRFTFYDEDGRDLYRAAIGLHA